MASMERGGNEKNNGKSVSKDPTKPQQEEGSKEKPAATSKCNYNNEEMNVLAAIVNYGYQGLLVVNGLHACMTSVKIDLAQVIRESPPDGHLIRILKGIKLPGYKMVSRDVALLEAQTNLQISRLHAKVNFLQHRVDDLSKLPFLGENRDKVIKDLKPMALIEVSLIIH